MCNTDKKKLITKVIVSVLAVGSLYNYNICDTNNCFAEDLDGTNSEGHVVEVNDGDTYSSVYGIQGERGKNEDVSGGTVNINGGKVTSQIYGGKSNGGDKAEDNTVNIKGGEVTVDYVYGGSALQDASYNIINVSGGTVKGLVGGIAGPTGGNSHANVANNEINISGGIVRPNNSIEAGEVRNGNAIKNKVNITGGDIDADNGFIIGGQAVTKGEANENKLNIKGVSIRGNFIAGKGVDAANTNKICIEGSTIRQESNMKDNEVPSFIYGGESFKDVKENLVSIKNSKVELAYITGGHISINEENINGSVTNNKVILDNVTVNSGLNIGNYTSLITGGYIMNGNSNSISMDNHVTIKGDSYITCQIAGGFVKGGDAKQNKITIESGTVDYSKTNRIVIGGYSSNKNADGNIVTITGGTIIGEIVGGYSGGELNKGSASGNTVDIQGGTVIGEVFGGYRVNEGESDSNIVRIANTANLEEANLYGRADDGGTGNNLVVENWQGTINSIGSFNGIDIDKIQIVNDTAKPVINIAEDSTLSDIAVNIKDVNVSNDLNLAKGDGITIIGGEINFTGNRTFKVDDTAKEDKINEDMSNGVRVHSFDYKINDKSVTATVNKSVLAGNYNNGKIYSSTANENTLILNQDINTNANIIAGSYATDNNTAENGKIIISGKYNADNVENKIYAGYSENGDGKVSGNAIELQSGADVAKADLYGVNDEAVANASSNNLNINGFNGTVNSLKNFDNINIGEVGFEDGAVNITSKESSKLENASLNATFTGTNNTIYDKGENKDVIVLNNISIGNSNITNKSDGDIIASTADNNGVEVNRLNLTTKQEQENGQTNTIVNAEVTERILAGKYTNNMGTYGNEEGKLTIGDGFTTTASTIAGSYSSFADKEATGGTVVVNGKYTAGKTSEIYAGYSENGDGKVSGNTIKLQSGADVSKADLYGANDEAVQNNNASNNSLNIDGFNGAVNSLKNFDNLNFGDVSFNSNIQLTANTFSNLSKATINVSSYNKNTEIYDEGTTGKIITLNNIKVEKDATGLDNAYGDIIKETGNGVQVNRLNVDTDYSDEEKKTTVTATVDKYILAGSYTNKDKTYGTTDGVLTLDDNFNSNASTIAGSYSSAGDKEATGGTVVVNGKYTEGKTSEIYAGYSENGDGKVSGNTIKLQSGADVSKADLYGANNEAVKNNNASNNSLNVDGFSGKVNSINNFNQIDLGTVKATNETFNKNLDNAVLNVQSKGDLSGTNIKIDDITVDENLDLATGTQKTLIGGNNVTTDETTTVSASDEATANKYVQTDNGVRIHAFDYGADNGEVTATVKRSVLASKYIDENNDSHGENIVHIDDDFQTNAETITGSYAAESNKATGGEVIIDGNYDGKIYAGYSENGDGEVSGNTVTVNSNVNAKDTDLWGRNTDTGKDNNLNVNGKEVVIGSVKYFDNINMNNIEWENDKTVLTIDNGKDSDLSDTNINVNNLNVQGGATINVNDSMNLISGEDLNINGDKINIGEDFTAGVTAVGKGEIVADNNGLSYKIDEVAVNPQTSLIAENRAVATAFINQGSDLIASGLDSLHDQYGYGFKTFAAVYGNRSTYDAGSDLKINGWSEIIGLGSTKRINDGDLDWGVFYENGSGNYRTYNQFNDEFFRGDGSMVYNGGGVAARFTKDNGWYYEGSLRAGTLKSEIDHALKDGMGNTYGYKSDTTYYGAHLGVGKILSLSDSQDLNVYGKYFHTYNDGDDFTIAGDRFSFDSVTSDRIMLGAKLTTNKNNIWQTHYGLAWEYEFNGDSDMTAGQFNLPTQSLKGSTFIGEIGFSYRDDKFSPWSFDLDFKGYQGQRDGFSGHAQVTYNF